MMKLVFLKLFIFEGGDCVVLLLYGFIGNLVDVCMLGCFLEKKGYICYVLIYKGYGVLLEEFVYIGFIDWW